MPRQSHPEQEFIYVDYGKLILAVNSKEFLMDTGDCFIIPPGASHDLRNFGKKSLDYLNIKYTGFVSECITGKLLHLRDKERQLLEILKRETREKPAHFGEILFLKLNELFSFSKEITQVIHPSETRSSESTFTNTTKESSRKPWHI